MKVAIHDGRFHSDEAFAVAVLKMLGPINYIRTRDESLLKTCDLRIDVGRKYDPKTGDFDHHQPQGAGKRQNGIPYAAFGLVWKHFGAQITMNQKVADLVDAHLVQVLDAVDSGFDLFNSKIEGVTTFGLDKVVDYMMPSWQINPTSEQMNQHFEEAVELATQVLQLTIAKTKDRIDGEEYVRHALMNLQNERLVVLDKQAPWEEIIIKEAAKVLFVVGPYWPAQNNYWVVQAVNKKLGSYENRKDLPASWAGKVDDELAKVTGVKDAKFCHTARFLAVAVSKQGALKLAQLALQD